MDKVSILWADDEIDLLKPHILFLEEKGYHMITANNGDDALDALKSNVVDIVFLDENMPGLSGLETLVKIKAGHPSLPVIMITKSEEESIMEEAIGSKISDYLIKPVNPKQILLSIKKNLDNKRLISETSTSAYQREFRQIGMSLSDRLSVSEWHELYRKLVYWEMELGKLEDEGMEEILKTQKAEANSLFSRYVERNYEDWITGDDADKPLLSHEVFKKAILPEAKEGEPLFVVVIDNLRYDQWLTIRPLLTQYFRVEQDDLYFSILPTATHYARNALFAGLMPLEIEKMYRKWWKNEDEDGGKNMFEKELLGSQLERLRKQMKYTYNKVTTLNFGKKLAEQFHSLMNNDLNVIVYNFVDMLSHARTEMEVIRELAQDEAAYRSITLSWFEHSPLLEIFRKIADAGCKVVLTTDHGTIHVKNPVKIVGDRNTNTNLRYKVGRNLNYDESQVFTVKDPAAAKLPKTAMSSRFVFAKEDQFFAYPNNYNYYVNYYRDTFQHGGVSLEEMVIPLVTLTAK